MKLMLLMHGSPFQHKGLKLTTEEVQRGELPDHLVLLLSRYRYSVSERHRFLNEMA